MSTDFTFVAPYDFGILTNNPLSGVSTTHNSDEYGKGMKLKTLELAWDQYETSDGSFDASYIVDKQSELASYQAQGFNVVLELGVHYVPGWVSSIDANALYKNQYGDTYAPNTPGKNIANSVFNNTVRSQQSAYVSRVFNDLGTDFYAIRLGGGWFGELQYPVENYNSRINSFWGYDANAQGGVSNLPTGVDVNPVPGWVPNPVDNGTFENGDDANWTLGGAMNTIVSSDAHRGSKALQMVNPGAWTNRVEQDVPVVSGRTYRYSVWAKTSDPDTSTPPCLQILTTTESEIVSPQCAYSTSYQQITGTFTPNVNTVRIVLVTYATEAGVTLTFDDVSLMDSNYSYDATDANATSFWEWYRDSLVNYQNWQVTQVRNAGFNSRIFMLYPSYGLRTDANTNWATESIGYDLSYTSIGNAGGTMQQATDWGTQVANLSGSDSNIYVYSTWIDSTGTDGSSDKKDWSAVKYLSYIAGNNSRKLYGENTGNNNYSQMQTAISNMTNNGYLGMLWFSEPQLYGGTYATAANYQTQIAANDGTSPYNLSSAINTGGSFGSQSIPLTISATDNVSSASDLQMILGNDSSFTGSSWQSYNTSTSYTLPTGNSDRTIYLQVKDAAGNTSNAYNTSFLLPSSPSSLAQYQSDGTTSISSGSTLGVASTVVLKFSMSSTNSSDSLTPQVEVQHQGTAFTNTSNYSGSAVSFTGTAVTGTVTIPNMGSGSFHWQAGVSNSAGQSSWVAMGGNPDFSVAFSPASNNSSAPSCGDQAPGAKAPWLYGAIAQDSGSVLLYFTEADNPVDKYILEYGTSSGNYQYGVLNMGINIRGQMTYLVKSLNPNATYYFRVRGGNGCAAGTWSNEISAKTKGLFSTNQLEITLSELIPQTTSSSEEQTTSNNSCQTYTVKSGNSLWNIASKLLGSGNKYKDIINQNKEKYPSLETSNNLSTGWELKLNCTSQQLTEEKKTTENTQKNYDVKVKVVDTEKKPVEGATVTLHSNPQTTKTDKSGIALFHNVEQGEHKVLIAYNNFEGEQSVNLTGDVKEFDLNVTVQQKAISLSPLAYGIIGVMTLVIFAFVLLLIKARKNKA